MMTQSNLERQATEFLLSKNLRWDGRKFVTDPKKIKSVKAQIGFERRLVSCPFSGQSMRKR